MTWQDYGYRTGQGDLDYEPAEDLCNDPGSYITDDGRCSNCGVEIDFENLKAIFVVEESGTQPGTVHGPAVHWATGYIVCPQCKEKLPYETST